MTLMSSCPVPIDVPYPGLRPFNSDEAVIFFGRGEQIDDMLTRLEDRRFLAVVGASGSGKSSLVKAGLIPALRSGYLLGAGADWLVIDMAPYPSPFGNFAERFEASFAAWTKDDSSGDVSVKQSLQSRKRPSVGLTQSTLQSGPDGFLEVLKDARVPKDVGVLILVDQFEEIFKLRKSKHSDLGQRNQAVSFVELLLRTARQTNRPVYVLLTMRSDYLGDCDIFTRLPEEISRSQFLTPRLTREQIREAIVGPLGIFGVTAEESLTTQVLNDIGNNSDQLPRMQHALMRTWSKTFGGSNRDTGKPLTVEIYNQVGGFQEALNRHATEAWNELGDRKRPNVETELQRVARTMFCALSDRTRDGKLTRRKQTIQELADVADTSIANVIAAASAFQRDDRYFVYGVPRGEWTAATTLDIGHEAFLRQWSQFRDQFLRDEEEASRLYRRLEEMAADWKSDSEAVCRDPVLSQAKRWRDRKPTPAWAARYGSKFELVNEFIIASEQRAKKDRRESKNSKLRKWILVGMIPLLLFFFLAVIGLTDLLDEAEVAREEAEAATAKARLSEISARESANDAKREARDAAESLAKSYFTRAELAFTQDRVEESVFWSWRAFEKLPVDDSAKRLFARRQIAWNTSSIEEATQVPSFPTALAFSSDGQLVATGFRDGVVKLWETSSGRLIWRIRPLKEKIISFAFSASGRWLAAGGLSAEVAVLNIPEQEILTKLQQPKDPKEEFQAVNCLEFTPTAELLVCGLSTGKIVVWQLKRRDIFLHGELDGAILAMSVRGDGSRVACGTSTGDVRILDLDNEEFLANTITRPSQEIWTIAFSPDGEQLLVATASPPNWDRGELSYWNAATGTLLGQTIPTTGAIHRIGFFPDGNRFVTAALGVRSPPQLWRITSDGSTTDRRITSDGPAPIPVATDQNFFHVEVVNAVAGVRILAGSDDVDRSQLHWTEFSDNWTPQATFPAVDVNPLKEMPQPGRVRALAIHPNGTTLAVGSGQTNQPLVKSQDNLVRKMGWLKLWNLTTGKEEKTVLESQTAEILCAAYSSDGTLLAAGDSLGNVTVQGLGDQPLTLSHEGQLPVWALKFVPDERRLVAVFGSKDGKVGDVRIWQFENAAAEQQEIKRQEPSMPWKAIVSLAISPSGQKIVVGRSDGFAGIFHLEPTRLTEVRWLDHGGADRQSGSRLNANDESQSNQTSQAAMTIESAGISRPTWRSTAVWSVTFNESSDLIFTAGGMAGGTTAAIRKWSVETGAPIGKMFSHPTLIYAIAPLNGGSLILSACDDGSVGNWDVEVEKLLGRLSRRQGFFEAIAVHPDGRSIFVGGESQMVYRFAVPPPATENAEHLDLSVRVHTQLKYDAEQDGPVLLTEDEFDAAKQELKQRFQSRRGDLQSWKDVPAEQRP